MTPSGGPAPSRIRVAPSASTISGGGWPALTNRSVPESISRIANNMVVMRSAPSPAW